MNRISNNKPPSVDEGYESDVPLNSIEVKRKHARDADDEKNMAEDDTNLRGFIDGEPEEEDQGEDQNDMEVDEHDAYSRQVCSTIIKRRCLTS